MSSSAPFVTLQSRRPADSSSLSSRDSTYGSSAGDEKIPAATHDTSRVNYHVKDISHFAASLEGSAARAFPNRGSSQRYTKVHAILLHWKCDDLFVLPELEDLESCFREDYSFETETFPIPSDNAHLELMLRIGAMIKEHESTETLFIVYYGGHAKIDDSRQSTWCATRATDSPWLQWSAIQTLLERSLSDVLILLDCCAGAASATFPSGNSVTETISASSWDAIAPDPGRYSFTTALIEVLSQWKRRVFSAAMLHAEVLARLKHPRPVMINGRHYEARSTPVHFMMTNNHKVPSIELGRVISDGQRPPSPPEEVQSEDVALAGRSAAPQEIIGSSPNEDIPHVMISLALEDNQRLNIAEWQQWLSTIPALAKYVKVQGVFKSHSTLLLLSMPVSIWNVLPDDQACNFVAFIRSNNLAMTNKPLNENVDEGVGIDSDMETVDDLLYEPSTRGSVWSGTTAFTYQDGGLLSASHRSRRSVDHSILSRPSTSARPRVAGMTPSTRIPFNAGVGSRLAGTPARKGTLVTSKTSKLNQTTSSDTTAAVLHKHQNERGTYISDDETLPSLPALAPHVESRLEDYFLEQPYPSVAVKEFFASNLGIETTDIDLWFHHRRGQQEVSARLQSLTTFDNTPESQRDDVQMLLPGNLKSLLEDVPAEDVLLIDLRSPDVFNRSHIHGAFNVRAPASFISQAPLELLERALDEEKQHNFSKWKSSRCVVFYDRHVEFPWEAPSAGALFNKLREQLWTGQCFVLKGHYREFSTSFDKHIAGSQMTEAAQDYIASLKDSSKAKQQDGDRYSAWLKILEEENTIHYTDLADTAKTERLELMVAHQKELEVDFDQRHPSLCKKARDHSPLACDWKLKASIVPHLDRGLELMREAEGKAAGLGKETQHPRLAYQDYPRTTNPDKIHTFAEPDDYPGQSSDKDADGDSEVEHRASEGFYKGGRSGESGPVIRSSTHGGEDSTFDKRTGRLPGGRGIMSRFLHGRRSDGPS